jgi:hypothetical protein
VTRDGCGGEGLSFLERALPPQFDRRVVEVAPGVSRIYMEAEWQDELVVVEQGQIELECLRGCCHRVERGAVLWLSGLPLRALHNRESEGVRLVAVSRR